MKEYYRRCCSRVQLNKQKGYYRSGLSKRAAKLLHRAMKPKKAAGTSYSLHEPKQHVVELYVKKHEVEGVAKGVTCQRPVFRICQGLHILQLIFVQSSCPVLSAVVTKQRKEQDAYTKTQSQLSRIFLIAGTCKSTG